MNITIPVSVPQQTSLELIRSSAKLAGFVFLAALITFSLFIIMQKLIHQDSVMVIGPEVTSIPNVFLSDELDSVTQTKNSLPEKPKMLEQPKPIKTQLAAPDEVAVTGKFAMHRPSLAIEKSLLGLSTAGNDARPIVRVPPRYPIEASRNGTEGWVQLEFTIDSSGTVKDVKVTDSKPKRIFDAEAKRALRKWKYKPQIVDGKATDLPNMQVVLDFKLDS